MSWCPTFCTCRGIVLPTITILSLFMNPRVIPNPHDVLPHKSRSGCSHLYLNNEHTQDHQLWSSVTRVHMMCIAFQFIQVTPQHSVSNRLDVCEAFALLSNLIDTESQTGLEWRDGEWTMSIVLWSNPLNFSVVVWEPGRERERKSAYSSDLTNTEHGNPDASSACLVEMWNYNDIQIHALFAWIYSLGENL